MQKLWRCTLPIPRAAFYVRAGCNQRSYSATLIVFQLDVDEETAEKLYEKLLELEKQTLERYSDLLD